MPFLINYIFLNLENEFDRGIYESEKSLTSNYDVIEVYVFLNLMLKGNIRHKLSFAAINREPKHLNVNISNLDKADKQARNNTNIQRLYNLETRSIPNMIEA